MILIGATCAAYKCDGSELNWLHNAEALRDVTIQPVEFFLALQIGQGRDQACERLQERVEALDGETWRFSIDENATKVTSSNRLIGICTGRNLITERATRDQAVSHILFLDTDLLVEPDCVNKLLEVADHEREGQFPLVGGNVPSYCLDGPRDLTFGGDVRTHWNTAGFLLVHRRAFRELRWRWDPDIGLTDDPAYAQDALARGFGETKVRHDVIGHHEPLVALEHRQVDRSIR